VVSEPKIALPEAQKAGVSSFGRNSPVVGPRYDERSVPHVNASAGGERRAAIRWSSSANTSRGIATSAI
jgi:hypothetical protein